MKFCEEDKPLNFKIQKIHSSFGVITTIFLDVARDDGQEQTFVLGTLMPLVLNESEIDIDFLLRDFKVLLRNYEKRFYARDEDAIGDISKKYFGLSDEVELFGIFDTQAWEFSVNNLFIKETRFLKEKLKIIEVSHHVSKIMETEYNLF